VVVCGRAGRACAFFFFFFFDHLLMASILAVAAPRR